MKAYARNIVCALLQAAAWSQPALAARSDIGNAAVIEAVVVPSQPAHVLVRAGEDWWSAFAEEPLNRFMRMSCASPEVMCETPDQQAGHAPDAVALYVSLRIQQLRLAVNEEHRAALLLERQSIAQRPPRRELASFLVDVDRRLSALDTLGQALAGERMETARLMLRLTGDSEEARQTIGLAASASGVPRFLRDVPVRLPASVLASRPEVAFAARVPTLKSALPDLLSGWVEMANSPAPLVLQPLADELPVTAVVKQAAHDVGWGLRLLAQSASQVQLQSRRLDAAKLAWQAAQERARIGDDDPAIAPRALQSVLVQADGLILAYGRLALAWIDLHRKAPAAAVQTSSAPVTH